MAEAARVLCPGGLFVAVVNGARLQQVEVRCAATSILTPTLIPKSNPNTNPNP